MQLICVSQGSLNTGREFAQSLARKLDYGFLRREEIVDRAVRGAGRERVVLSTKKSLERDGRVGMPAELRAGLEASVRSTSASCTTGSSSWRSQR